jgi:hypothetical protein
VLLSANPKNVNPACYINLKKGFNKEKEVIIVLTLYVFGIPYVDKDGKKTIISSLENPSILHEIAHHIMGHYKLIDQKDFEEKQKAAWEQAERWVTQWVDFKSNQ